jgi:hypothetical protein
MLNPLEVCEKLPRFERYLNRRRRVLFSRMMSTLSSRTSHPMAKSKNGPKAEKRHPIFGWAEATSRPGG